MWFIFLNDQKWNVNVASVFHVEEYTLSTLHIVNVKNILKNIAKGRGGQN